MVRFDSWRAVRLGNWPDRNLATKSTERWARAGAGQEKAIKGEGILGAQEAEAIHQPTNERIHRDQAFGFQLAEGHMNGPAIWADQAETIKPVLPVE